MTNVGVDSGAESNDVDFDPKALLVVFPTAQEAIFSKEEVKRKQKKISPKFTFSKPDNHLWLMHVRGPNTKACR